MSTINKEVPESILQKVQKLQALAERAGTLAEAENATVRITEILMKYNLDLATVAEYKAEEKDDVINEKHDLNQYQTYHDGDFAKRLIDGLAKFNFCRVVGEPNYHDKRDQGHFVIIGQRHNVEAVMYMYHYCINNIKVLSNEMWKVYDKRDTKIKTVFTRHFFDGAVSGIISRLIDNRMVARKEHGEALNSLIRLQDAKVDDAISKLYSNLVSSKSKTQRDTDAKKMGYAAGSKLDLHKGLGGESNNLQKRLS